MALHEKVEEVNIMADPGAIVQRAPSLVNTDANAQIIVKESFDAESYSNLSCGFGMNIVFCGLAAACH